MTQRRPLLFRLQEIVAAEIEYDLQEALIADGHPPTTLDAAPLAEASEALRYPDENCAPIMGVIRNLMINTAEMLAERMADGSAKDLVDYEIDTIESLRAINNGQ